MTTPESELAAEPRPSVGGAEPAPGASGGAGGALAERVERSVDPPATSVDGLRRGDRARLVRCWLVQRRVDLAAVISFALLAFWVTARLWLHPDNELRANPADHAQFEWMLAHGARVATDFAYPFASARMNVPDGVNLMANTSVLAISIPLSPITVIFGPGVSFLVFLTGGLIATATSWYFLLSRVLVPGFSGAAWLGAAFCGFAPAMVSHANGHPNIVSQFVVPLIVWRTLRLGDAGRWRRNGALLALLIVWQAFINLEILLMVAVGLGVVVGVLALRCPELRHRMRPFLAGLAVAAGLAGLLLAYPLYVQLLGDDAYHGLSRLIRGYRADLASFVAYSTESVAGDARSADPLAQNPSEENAFFGWPLVVLVIGVLWWLRGRAVVLGLAIAGLLFAVLSLGRQVRVEGRPTGVPGPWAVLERLPLLHSVVPTRWALALTPIIGILLALAGRELAGLVRRHPSAGPQLRLATGTVLAMALLPIAPTPLPTARPDPTPDFVSSGAWREYVTDGRSLVTLPLPDSNYPEPLRWSAQTGLALPLARGYFLGPDTRPDAREGRIALFGAVPRSTSSYFNSIRRTGAVPPITPQRRVALVGDLLYWRAGVVVLGPHRHENALRRGMTELSGISPVRTGGVWLWDIRPLVD